MRACPSCGHEGEPNTVKRDKYSVLTCSLCGVGLGVELHFEGPSADRAAQSHHNTTDTDAYKLTPTGPHKVVSAAAHEASRPADQHYSERVSGSRKVFIVSGSQELAEGVIEAAKDTARREEIDCAGDNQNIVEAFSRCLNEGSKPKLILLDSLAQPIPVVELVHVLRSIETGMNETRTPILVLGDSSDEGSLKPSLAQLGNARFVRRGTDPSPASQGPRIISLVSRVLNRGK